MATSPMGATHIRVVATDKHEVLAYDVSPRQAFSRTLFEGEWAADPRYLRREGDTIILDTDNGRWIWQVIEEHTDTIIGQWPD